MHSRQAFLRQTFKSLRGKKSEFQESVHEEDTITSVSLDPIKLFETTEDTVTETEENSESLRSEDFNFSINSNTSIRNIGAGICDKETSRRVKKVATRKPGLRILKESDQTKHHLRTKVESHSPEDSTITDNGSAKQDSTSSTSSIEAYKSPPAESSSPSMNKKDCYDKDLSNQRLPTIIKSSSSQFTRSPSIKDQQTKRELSKSHKDSPRRGAHHVLKKTSPNKTSRDPADKKRSVLRSPSLRVKDSLRRQFGEKTKSSSHPDSKTSSDDVQCAKPSVQRSRSMNVKDRSRINKNGKTAEGRKSVLRTHSMRRKNPKVGHVADNFRISSEKAKNEGKEKEEESKNQTERTLSQNLCW